MTNSFHCYLSLSVWFMCVHVCMCACVCVCVCVFIYTISISIICVSQEEPSLIAYNQQIYHFYKSIIWKRKDIVKCEKYIFDISELLIS